MKTDREIKELAEIDNLRFYNIRGECAYIAGFIEGYKQAQPKWIDVQSDIVIPNEMLLVERYNGEHEVIFYDDITLPNFRWYIPISSLPTPPTQ